MKASKYNRFIKFNDEFVLAFNCISGAFAKLTREKYELAKKILENGDLVEEDLESEKLKKELIRGRFLIDDKIDEMKILKFRNRIAKYNSSSLNLVIAPTLMCNLRCHYCYVDKNCKGMEPEIVNSVMKFVEKRVDRIQNLTVCWTGGEP